MRRRFDLQLEKLHELLIEMGGLCERAIANATEALQEGSEEMAKKVIEEDEEIDRMEKDVERLCLKLLLEQQPVARDLRQISAALKMITDMERIGDQTADIAEIIISGKTPASRDREKIGIMAVAVSEMVHKSVEAYVKRDLKLARAVLKSDDNVDRLFEEIREELIGFITEQKIEGCVAFDLMMITKYLERIGDHATNIAEWVEFSITGQHVKTKHFS